MSEEMQVSSPKQSKQAPSVGQQHQSCRRKNSGETTLKKRSFSTTQLDADKHVVEHDYHDHANEKKEDYPELLVESKPPPKKGKPSTQGSDSEFGDEYRVPRAKGGVTVPFPFKLHCLLDTIEQDGYEHIVSWQPHGRAFAVHKPDLFVSIIMPKYFKQTKLTSFQRQLNLYGFRRLTKGPDAGGYYHELFLRGLVFLCHKMTRIKIKGTGCKAASSPETEPDFYQMPYVQSRHVSMDETEEKHSAVEPPTAVLCKKVKEEAVVCRVESLGSLSESPPFKKVVPAVPVKPVLPSVLSSPTLCGSSYCPAPITPECQIRTRVTDVSSVFDSTPNIEFPDLPLVVSSRTAAEASSDEDDSCNVMSYSNEQSFVPNITQPSEDEDVILFEGKSFHYLPTADVIAFNLDSTTRDSRFNGFARSLSSECMRDMGFTPPSSFMNPGYDDLVRFHEISQEWD
jgi:hypothetical protein